MSVIVINLAAIEKLGIAKTEYAEMLQAVFALSEVLPFVPVEKQREIHELIEASKFTTGEQLRAWVGKAFLMTGCLEQDFSQTHQPTLSMGCWCASGCCNSGSGLIF